MRYRHRSNPSKRTIVAKYAGECACCGAVIRAGEMVDYYPVGTIAGRSTAAIAHVGGLDGTSARCTAEIRRKRDPMETNCTDTRALYREERGLDPGELAADQWAADHCPSDNR